MGTNFLSHHIPYSQTGKFSKIVLDYIDEAPALADFYAHEVSIGGIKDSIEKRKKFATNRTLLKTALQDQYQHVGDLQKVKENIDSLAMENTFTVCTAHQPNLFTGHLYFIYKILHTIRLANELSRELPEYYFVPVFFMGSEDADLEELNHVIIDGHRYEWHTSQTGAVGRMIIDEELVKLIDEIGGRLLVEKYGVEIVNLLKKYYTKGSTIQEATFLFIHDLFKDYGLIVLLSDKASFKKEIYNIMEADLFRNSSYEIVENTSEKLARKYKPQAYPREINLFYLKDDIRKRIIRSGDHFVVHDTDIVFTHEAMRKELKEYPERFSPNVILRGLFQEIILPDVAWIGGGGELSYWLQLRDLFDNFLVPYPVLVLRNSFLIIEEKYCRLMKKLSFEWQNLFKGKEAVLNELVKQKSSTSWDLSMQKETSIRLFKDIKDQAERIDATLYPHIEALETRFVKSLTSLEKKMFRAEKRKFDAQENQLQKLYSGLFPEGGLQERTENFMLYYAKYGRSFLAMIYKYSSSLDQNFCILEEN